MADERWTIKGCSVCGFESLVRKVPQGGALDHAVHEKKNPGEFEVETVPLAALSACQEELARVRQERDRFDDEAERLGIAKEEWRKDAEAAEAARDELARALQGFLDAWLDCDRQLEGGDWEKMDEAERQARAALSSEATKGDAE